MTEKAEVYLEGFVAAHNDCLRRKVPDRPDMIFKVGFARGDLVLCTRDRGVREISDDDLRVFDEVRREVSATHRLIVP